MKLKFTKMQGIGNDFVLVEEKDIKDIKITRPELAKRLCDRRYGIGADGLIIFQEKATDTDFEWDFYNSDGSVAEMCGNGIRCFARYISENGFTDKKEFTVKTLAGVKTPKINNDGTVTVNMGKPFFKPEEVPVVADTFPVLNQKITAKGKDFDFNAVGMGNPHCVIFAEGKTPQLALEYGSTIETSKLFPNKTNVEFVKIFNKNEIQVDVWERGCGITQACGTGTCASVVAAILNNLTNNEVCATLPGGQLKIKWDGSLEDLSQDVFMTGAADFVFAGEFLL